MSRASAATRIWAGTAGGLASVGTNWVGGVAPGVSDWVVFGATNPLNTCVWDYTVTLASVSVLGSYAASVQFNNAVNVNGVFEVNGASAAAVIFQTGAAGVSSINGALTVYNGGTFLVNQSTVVAASSVTVTGAGAYFQVDTGLLKTPALDASNINSAVGLYSTFGSSAVVTSTGATSAVDVQIGGQLTAAGADFKRLTQQGLRISQTALVPSFDAVTFEQFLLPGATAINFAAGWNVAASTFNNVFFADNNIAINVSAQAPFPFNLTMANSSGTRAGPGFESDPFNKVDWTFPPPPVVTVSGVSQAPAFLTPNETDRSMLALQVASDYGSRILSGLRVSLLGDIPAGLVKARIWRDANANGTLETGVDYFLGEAYFTPGAPNQAFIPLSVSISPATSTLFVALSYQNAPGGKAVQVGVFNPSDVAINATVGPGLPAVSARSAVRVTLPANPGIYYSTPMAGPPTGGGYDTQLFLNKGQQFHVEAAGSWFDGNAFDGPAGSAVPGGLGGGLFIGQLVGRIGGGSWLALNATSTMTAAQSGNLILAMSATNYAAVSGSLAVAYNIIPSTTVKAWVGGATGFPYSASIDANWAPASRPADREQVLFDAAAFDCNWDLPNVNLASLQMTTNYLHTVHLMSPGGGVRNSLTVSTDTVLQAGTLDLVGNDFIVNGRLVVKDSATLDLGGGGASLRVGTDLTISTGAFLRSVGTNGGNVLFTQAFGVPNWTFHIRNATVTVTNPAGLVVDARGLELEAATKINAFDHLELRGQYVGQPALKLFLSAPAAWTFTDWTFEMADSVNVYAGAVAGSTIVFQSARGTKMGSMRTVDPAGRVSWQPDGGGALGSISGILNYAGPQPSPYYVMASTSPTGAPTQMGGVVFVSTTGQTYTLSGLPTPATYYLIGFTTGYGIPPSADSPRGGYGHPGSRRSEPVFLGSGAAANNRDLFLRNVNQLLGPWSGTFTQVGPIRFQAWRGGDPLIVSTATLEAETVVAPASSSYNLFLPDATDYFIIGYVDVNNDRFPNAFEARGSSSPVTMAGALHSGVSIFINGGSVAPGGFVTAASTSASPGYIPTSGWSSVLAIDLGANTSSAAVNSLSLSFQGAPPMSGLSLAVFEDVNADGILQPGGPDVFVNSGNIPGGGGAFGVYGTTITFSLPQVIMAGTTRHYLVAVDLGGQSAAPFSVFVASPSNFGMGAGYVAGQPIYPMTSGLVSSRFFVPASAVANPDRTGGFFTGISIFPGQTLVTSSTGTWKRSAGDPGVGPDGAALTTGLNTVQPAANQGALIGRIQRFDSQPGDWFVLGSSSSVPIPNGGWLYVAMNDYVGAYADNSGAVAAAFNVLGSTVGAITGTVYYTGSAAGNVQLQALSGPVTASLLIPLVGGTTYYPYQLTRMQTSGGYYMTAQVLSNPIQQQSLYAPVASGATTQIDFFIPTSTGALTGVLSYSGVMPFGQFMVAVATSPNFTDHVNIVGSTANAAAGAYTISGLAAPATYYVVGFRSAGSSQNGGGGPKHAEPFGYYGTPGFGLSQFSTALTPVFVPTGSTATSVNFSIVDTGEIAGSVSLPAAPGGGFVNVLAGRGLPGSPGFVWENQYRQFYYNVAPAQLAYRVELLRPATNYTVFAFFDLNSDGVVSAGEPTFQGSGIAVPSGGSVSFNFPLVAAAPPTAPTGFLAYSTTSANVTFTWNLSQGATQYELRGSTGGALTVLLDPATFYTVTLPPNTSAQIAGITATNFNGTSSSVTIGSVYTLAAPPATLTVTGVTQTSANLTWLGGGNPLGTLYELERATVSVGPFGSVGFSTNTAKLDIGLSAGRTYFYRTRAYNGNGLTTAYSSMQSTTTNGASGPSILGVISYLGQQTGALRIEASTMPAFAPIAAVAALPLSVNQPYQLNVAPAATYYVRGYVDVNGDGLLSPGEDASLAFTAVVAGSPVTGQDFSINVDTVPPAAPAGLTPTPGFLQVKLTWASPTMNADGSPIFDLQGFVIERATVAAGPFAAVSPILSTTVFVDGSATPGVLQYYRVYALDFGLNVSARSGLVSATPSPGGSISGALNSYVAVSTAGVFHVRLSTLPYPGAPFIQDSTLPSYTFAGLRDGVYYVTAFQDRNGDGQADPLFEPAGTYGGITRPYAITIAGGNAVTGANAAVCDRSFLSVNSVRNGALAPGGCPARDKDAAFATDLAAIVVGGGQPGSIGPGAQVNLRLNSTYDNELILLGPDGGVFARDNRAGGAGLSLTLTTPGVYLIEPTSFVSSTSGPYALSMSVTGGFAGAVAGSVAYAGLRTGPVFVQLYNSADPSAFPIRVSTQAAPGPFSLGGLPDGTYYLRAFRDANGNGARDAGEPSAVFGIQDSSPTPINVTGGAAQPASAALTLTDPASGNVTGTLSYDGSQPGPLRVEIGVKSCTDCGQLDSVIAFASTGPGNSYTLPFLAPATNYFIQAYVDSNGNAKGDTLEAKGSAFPVSVVAGATTTISIVVRDPGFGASGNATVVGSVTYNGSQGGQIFIAVTKDPTFGSIDYYLTISTQGNYLRSGVAGGTTYYVGAFRDVNGNSNLDEDLGEPSGMGAPPNFVGNGKPPIFVPLSGLATAYITLTDPPSGSIRGRVSYNGLAPISQPLIVAAAIQGPGGNGGGYRLARITRVPGVTQYDYALPFLAASSSFSVTAWVDANPNNRQDPGEPVGYFQQSFCTPGFGCSSTPVAVSSGPGSFPSYNVNLDVRDQGGIGVGGAAGGRIQGELIYLGVQSGPILARAFDNPNFAGQPLFTQSIPVPPGPASVRLDFLSMPFGTFYIDAFRDTTGTGRFNPLVQGRTLFMAVVSSAQPQAYINGPALVDPGGAGSINAFTGNFAAPGGARFDGGSSDLSFMIAMDSVSAGAPYIYAAGVTTQLDGLDFKLVRYSSTGVVLASKFYDTGELPRLAADQNYLYVFSATPHVGGQTNGKLDVLDTNLNLVAGTTVLNANALVGGVVHNGFAYVTVQDASFSNPDIVRKINPFTGATAATGTFTFPGANGTPHGSGIAVDRASGNVYVAMNTGGGGVGDMAGLLKFGPNLGAPTIVKDITALQMRSGAIAVSPASGDVYFAYIDRGQSLGRIRRFDSNLVELGASSVPIALSSLGDFGDMTVKEDGSVYLAVTAPSGGGDYMVVRYSSALTPLASRSFDGLNGTQSDIVGGIVVYDSSNVFVTGSANNGANYDWATVRLNLTTTGSATGAGQIVIITTATATQAVYGSFLYNGSLASSGTLRAALLPWGDSVPVRVATAAFASSMPYLFNNVPAGRYVVRSFLDLNGSLDADPGEPTGASAANGFYFAGTTTLAGFNINLCDRRQIASGVDVFDTLTAQDCLSPELNSHQRLYTFQGQRGQNVTIGVEALGFYDSYVLLYGPRGDLVAYDDDSWGDGDALINKFALPEDGVYTIAAAAYDAHALGAMRLVYNGSAGSLGSIAGAVDYTGSQGGQMVVGLFRSPAFSTSTLAASQILVSTRAFVFNALASGVTYYVGAFIDVNLNKTPDPGEDAGVFGVAGVPSPILLASAQDVRGVRVLVQSSTASAPSGFITGAIAYSGTRTGPVRLEFWSSATFQGRPVALRELLAGPGNYDVSVPGNVTYFVRAYLDANTNFALDSDEPRGVYAPAGQGAQSVYVPVGGSLTGVNLTLRDAGTSASGGVAGEGLASIFPSTAVAGYQAFTATITYTAGAGGIAAGGSAGFGVPQGFLPPQYAGVTVVSTSAATLSAIGYAGDSAFVNVTAGTLLPGQNLVFVYASPFTPCAVSTASFQVSSSKDGVSPRQPLVAGSPAVTVRAGGAAMFLTSQGYLALEAGKLSDAQTLEARDQCGNRSPVVAITTVTLRAKLFNGAGFAFDPSFGVSTSAAVSTTSAVALYFAPGDAAKAFFAQATSTGFKNLELFYNLGFDATSYVGVSVLPAGAISSVFISTFPSGTGLSSATINQSGQAFILFTLGVPNLPWHVMLSSTPFKAGVSPIWETWGYGQPGVGTIAWDGRYSPWINGGGRVPNGQYFVRIEAGGSGVHDDSLTVAVNVAQLAGRVFDGGLTPNPPLPGARIQLYGPIGFTAVASDNSGVFTAPGVAAGVYNLSVQRDDFLPGSLRVTLTATGSVSTFTATTNGIAAAINAAGGLDIVLGRAPALVVVPSLAVGVSTSASDRWGSLQVRTATFSTVEQTFFSPLRLAAGTTTFDDGGQWDPGTQQFVRRTTMKFNVSAGAYVVEARLDGFAPSTAAVVVGAAGATVVLPPIASKGSIAGTVTLAANADPAGLDVSVDAVPFSTSSFVFGNSTRLHLAQFALSQAYVIGGLDAGGYSVRASASGLATTSTGPIVVPLNGQIAAVDPPTLTAGASISGTITVPDDTSNPGSFPPLAGGAIGRVYVNAWAPGTLSFGSTQVYVAAGVGVVVPYAIPGLSAGTTYLIYAGMETGGQTRMISLNPLPGAALGNATFNMSFTASSGIISGAVFLPPGNTDFINVSIQGQTIASSQPGDVGSRFRQNGVHTLQGFTCAAAGVPAPTGYCPVNNSSATFKLFGQPSQTLDLTITFNTTGATLKQRLSIVSGSTSTISIDLTGQTWSVSGAITNQVANALFNTNPRVVANAQLSAPPSYPVGVSSSAARVVAILQDPDQFSVAISTVFDPLTSRVGFLTSAGTFTVSNVPPGVYYVATVGLANCTTCDVLVPSVGRIVRVSTNVANVALTISDGFGVSGSVSLDGGLQDSDVLGLTLLNQRQEIVRSTAAALGSAANGVTANSVSYAFTNLPAGDFYTLVVRGSGAAPRYVGRPIRFPDASLSPTGLQSSLTGQNMRLARAAYVTGRLRDGGTGATIRAANAALLAPTFQISATANPWVEGGYAVAASSMAGRPILGDGTFRVGPLLPNVAYDVRLGQTSWDPNFLLRGSQNYTPVIVAGVTPQAGESRDLGVVSLNQGQSISGVVRSTGSLAALGGIKVSAAPSFSQQAAIAIQTYTDAQGRYTLWVSTFVSGQFDVTAAPRSGNLASNGLVYDEVTARGVTLLAGTTVDFILNPLFGAVTGQIVVEDAATGGDLKYPFGDLRGFPAAAINLQPVGAVPIRNPLGDIEERTDASGNFSVRGLSTGTYTLRVTSLGYSVFNATVTTSGSAFAIYTGSYTPSNYLPGNLITLRRGATVSGRIAKSDGSAPNAGEVGGVAAANFAAGEFVIGSVEIDRVGKTVNSYSISGFKPGVAYDLVILPGGRGDDVSFPPEGRGLLFSAAEATTTKNLNLTFAPTGIDCRATSKALGSNNFQVKIDCTKALRNKLPSDSDLDAVLALSTFTTAGVAPTPPNNTGQLLSVDKTLSTDRRQITAIYRAGAAETVFSLRLRATASTVDPTTGENFKLDKVFDVYAGLDSNVVERITNMNGGSVSLEPSGQDVQLGLDERSRVELKPGTFAYGDDANPGTSVIVASATISVGLTKARDRQSASVLSLQRMGYVPAALQMPLQPASMPSELYSAMSAYRTLAGTSTVGGANPLSSFYNIFLPAGVRHQLQQAADLTFSYNTALSSAALANPNAINVWFYNAALGRFVPETTNRRLDTVNKTITVSVDHFSVFVVLDSTPVIQAPNVIQTDEILAVNFPNPADCVTHANIQRNSALFGAGGVIPQFQGTMIRYSLPPGAASEAKINVYNVAGEKVRTINPGLLAGGITYYSPWNCANDGGNTVASGVYIGEVSWNGKRKFFKMAIIKGSGL